MPPQILLSANGTLPAPGRNLTSFAWRVASLPENRTVATASGFAGRLKLPTGRYIAQLAAADSRGGGSTAAREFVIGSSSDPRAANASGAVATIALPPPSVPAASGSGLTRVALDASGSVPAAGAALASVLWAVVALPGRDAAANSSGVAAEVWLLPGEYQVRRAAAVGGRDRAEGQHASPRALWEAQREGGVRETGRLVRLSR